LNNFGGITTPLFFRIFYTFYNRKQKGDVNMEKLMEKLDNHTTVVDEEGMSIWFTDEAFIELYDTYKEELKATTIKGVLIGATATGLVGFGIWGINKFRKRRSLNVDKNGDPIKAPKKVKEGQSGAVEINNGKIVKKTKVDKEALTAIIKEVNGHEGNVKH
jgi:hypothetical protein